jgi:hypothetical protein
VIERVDLGAGAVFELALPADAPPVPAGALPRADLSNLPGARVVAARGYDGADGLSVRLLCASAPSSGWATGVEEIVLGRATQLAREAIARDAGGGEITRFTVADAVPAAGGFDQRFSAEVRRGADAFTVAGGHWLGFRGDARDAVLCTSACTERAGANACDALQRATIPTGAWQEAPPPNLLALALLGAAAHPWPAFAMLAAASSVAAAIILARRPRPRP